MAKWKERTQQMKKDDKGFTLVELIIVVAVIAVLAAVLAPQYLQYVERSRESNDLQVATSIMRASTVALADPKNDVSGGTTFTIRWATASPGGTGGDVMFSVQGASDTAENTAVYNAIAEIMGWSTSAAGNFGFVPDDAQSAKGNTEDFIFSIASNTGEIVLGASGVDAADIITAWGKDGVGVNP